jgi:hypothetical protein
MAQDMKGWSYNLFYLVTNQSTYYLLLIISKTWFLVELACDITSPQCLINMHPRLNDNKISGETTLFVYVLLVPNKYLYLVHYNL